MKIHVKSYNSIDNNISGQGNLIRHGRAITDIARSARIILSDDLILGENLRKETTAETYLKMQDNSILNVNGRFKVFFGASVESFKNAELTLGRGYINSGGTIACARSITIGDGVFIGRNTYITDSDHHEIYDETGKLINPSEPVYIGDHVLICFGSVVLKGVTIGSGSVIGAGSVVTKDIPDKCLAVGNPARVIREGIEWK